MLINSFFKLKLYHLNVGWLELPKNNNQSSHLSWENTKLIFLDQNISNLKKTFLLFQNVFKNKGTIFITTSYYYYFKSIFNLSYLFKEFILNNYHEGFLSNYLYHNNFKMIPDLILILNSKNNQSLFKEIKHLGIPSIGISNSLVSYHAYEYFIYLNHNSYFINYLIFKIYSHHLKIIKLQ